MSKLFIGEFGQVQEAVSAPYHHPPLQALANAEQIVVKDRDTGRMASALFTLLFRSLADAAIANMNNVVWVHPPPKSLVHC